MPLSASSASWECKRLVYKVKRPWNIFQKLNHQLEKESVVLIFPSATKFPSLSLSVLSLCLSFSHSLSLPSLLFSLSLPLSPSPPLSTSPHTETPFQRGFFPTQWSKVFAPLWGRLINIPTAASLQGFYFCNSVGRSRGHSGEVKRKKW